MASTLGTYSLKFLCVPLASIWALQPKDTYLYKVLVLSHILVLGDKLNLLSQNLHVLSLRMRLHLEKVLTDLIKLK